MTSHPWLADRTASFDASGIRKVFDLAAKLDNPINLSIGQPHFDVPQSVKDAAIEAIHEGKNAYSPTQGIAPLRQSLLDEVQAEFGHEDRDVFVCSGTSGGLALAMLAMVNPGDEVIFLDPYFVMYPALIEMCGGVSVKVNSYPSFDLDPSAIEAAMTGRTKMVIVNSPGNPTGVVATPQALREVAELCERKGVALISDEIYSRFVYDAPFDSPARRNESTIVIDGFSKSHAMTGWRVGYVHGPTEVIQTMLKLQQYSFVCSPQPAQWGALQAMQVNLDQHIADYRRKRDLIVEGLASHFELAVPGGAFYVFPKAPDDRGGEAFVHEAIERGLLIIPGKIFSDADTHFRVSFAATDETIHRGIEVLQQLSQ
ncbi:MAG: aminotransferase class I/II-fold pyridoxal phosphate-dependent enzyme [Planctomycetota bacterium]